MTSPETRLTRLRCWLDRRDAYWLWRGGNVLLCLLTGHVEVENVNVRSKWDTMCAWCAEGMQRRPGKATDSVAGGVS